MKVHTCLAILALATSCSSSVAPNPNALAMHQQHEQILNLQKKLVNQASDLDQTSLTKLTNIVDESTATIKELDNPDASKWQDSEQLGLVNQLALKESILLLAAQQIPSHATFLTKH